MNSRLLNTICILCLCLGIVGALRMASAQTPEGNDPPPMRNPSTVEPLIVPQEPKAEKPDYQMRAPSIEISPIDKARVGVLQETLSCSPSLIEYKKASASYYESSKKCEEFTKSLFNAIKLGKLNESEMSDYAVKKSQCLQSSFYLKWPMNDLDYTSAFHAMKLFQQISNILDSKLEKLYSVEKETCKACNGKWPEQEGVMYFDKCASYSGS